MGAWGWGSRSLEQIYITGTQSINRRREERPLLFDDVAKSKLNLTVERLKSPLPGVESILSTLQIGCPSILPTTMLAGVVTVCMMQRKVLRQRDKGLCPAPRLTSDRAKV